MFMTQELEDYKFNRGLGHQVADKFLYVRLQLLPVPANSRAKHTGVGRD